MRAMGSGRVAVSEGDIRDFASRWPCSGLRGLKGVTFEFDGNGDLVDVTYRNGESERWDGPALAALSQDAQEYLASTVGGAKGKGKRTAAGGGGAVVDAHAFMRTHRAGNSGHTIRENDIGRKKGVWCFNCHCGWTKEPHGWTLHVPSGGGGARSASKRGARKGGGGGAYADGGAYTEADLDRLCPREQTTVRRTGQALDEIRDSSAAEMGLTRAAYDDERTRRRGAYDDAMEARDTKLYGREVARSLRNR